MVQKFPFTKIVNEHLIEYGDPVWIDDFVLIVARRKIKIGSYVHIAAYCSITGDGELEIGDFCGISYGSRILLNNDDFSGNTGLNNPTVPDEFRGKMRGDCRIVVGRHVLIGANCVVMPGLTIGDGCAFGANSFINQDCPDWGMYVGTPVRRVKERQRDTLLAMEGRVREGRY